MSLGGGKRIVWPTGGQRGSPDRWEGVVKRLLIRAAAVSFVVLALGPSVVHAQFNGHNTKGDFGLLSGSQAPPGFYLAAPIYVRYDADTLRNSEGDRVSLDPDRRGSLAVNAYVVGLIWVSEYKIFGGNYSIQVYPAFTDNALEVPILGTNDSVSTGFTDLYFQPINLGWHTARADFIAEPGDEIGSGGVPPEPISSPVSASTPRPGGTNPAVTKTWVWVCGASRSSVAQPSTSTRPRAGTSRRRRFTRPTPTRKTPTSGWATC